MSQPSRSHEGPFIRTFHARWGDMDFNGHMRNTAYLDVAGDVRLMFFVLQGFSMSELSRLGIGPVIVHDEISYERELRLLDSYDVDLRLAGLSEDGSRFKMRNSFFRADGKHAATVTSTGGWLDLALRRFVPPPSALAQAVMAIPHDPGFLVLTSGPDRSG